MTWETALAALLLANAALMLGYRIYRLSRGGPIGDVIGGGILAVLLSLLAVAALITEAGWVRWPALVYAVLFAVLVMPIWVLAVLIPLPPERVDYIFTALYWLTLIGIGVAAIGS